MISLLGSCGLLDPCEKESTDATGGLTEQEREDLTAGAQVLCLYDFFAWFVALPHHFISEAVYLFRLISHLQIYKRYRYAIKFKFLCREANWSDDIGSSFNDGFLTCLLWIEVFVFVLACIEITCIPSSTHSSRCRASEAISTWSRSRTRQTKT